MFRENHQLCSVLVTKSGNIIAALQCPRYYTGGSESIAMDAYESFAERYDWMKQDNPARQESFRQLFAKHEVTKVLDCACGTGRDLVMFHALGLQAFGSDLSDAMLSSHARISEKNRLTSQSRRWTIGSFCPIGAPNLTLWYVLPIRSMSYSKTSRPFGLCTV